MKLPIITTLLASLAVPATLAATQQFGPLVPFAERGYDPGWLNITDVDGDGELDILTARDAFALVAGDVLWRKGLGDVTYAEPVPLISNAGGLHEPALVDVDMDGREEIVALVRNFGVALFEREGDGFASEPILLAATSLLGERMRVGDVDGDGVTDLVVGTSQNALGGAEVFTLFGDGAGSFGPPQTVAIVSAPARLCLLAIDDVDGDGDLDVLLNSDGQNLVIARWEGSGGYGPLEVIDAAAGEVLSTLALDFTGDGLLDVMSISTTSVLRFVVLPGLPGGGFGPPSFLGSSGSPQRLQRVDLDGDGLEDLLIRGSDTLWMRQVGPGSFANGANAALDGDTRGASRVAFADMDGDGIADAVGRFGSPTTGDALKVIPGQSSGTPLGLSIPVQLESDFWSYDIGDLDGDGAPEVVGLPLLSSDVAQFYSHELESVVAGAPGPRFVRRVLEDPEFDNVREIVFQDLGGDGLDDLTFISGGRLLHALAEPGFGLAPAVSVGWVDSSVRPVAEDVDQDGLIDLVASSASASAVVWFRNLGAGAFASEQVLQSTQSPISQIRFVDLNADGERDLVVSELSTSPGLAGLFWSARSGGTVGPRQILNTGLDQSVSTFAIGDLDGDGRADVAWGAVAFDTFAYWARGLGGGSFSSPAVLSDVGNAFRELEFVDLDLDGRQDLVVRLRRTIRYAINEGAAMFPDVRVVGFETTGLAIGDVDGDGDMDLISTTSNFGANNVFSENLAIDLAGTPVCGPAIANSSGVGARVVAVGSASVASNNLRLQAADLPISTLGFFLTSQLAATTFPVPGSEGRLCLGGAIGRYVAPGQVRNSGALGRFQLPINPSALPTPSGPAAAVVGATSYFQAWFRDQSSTGTSSSNFTDAIGVQWVW